MSKIENGNGNGHKCQQSHRLLRIERDAAAFESQRRESLREMRESLSSIGSEIVSFETNMTNNLERLKREIDERFKSILCRIEILSRTIGKEVAR